MYVCMHACVYVRMYVYIHVHSSQKAIVSGIGNTSVSGMVYSYGLGPLMRVSLIWYTVMDEDLARPAAFERWPRLCAQVRIISGTKVLELVVLKYLFSTAVLALRHPPSRLPHRHHRFG